MASVQAPQGSLVGAQARARTLTGDEVQPCREGRDHHQGSAGGDTCLGPQALGRRKSSSSRNVIYSTERPRTSRTDHLGWEAWQSGQTGVAGSLPFLRELSQVAHLKQSRWKTQCLAFMTRSVGLISTWHRAQVLPPPYSLKKISFILLYSPS